MTSGLPKDVTDFLKEYEETPQLKDSELTVERAAAFWECPHNTAVSRLKRMVRDGKVTKEYRKTFIRDKTFTVTVYIPKENK